MEYENIDENVAYKEACEKVKQIAEAIRYIRIKYYPNFARISQLDKENYDKLNKQMDQIAQEHGLFNLKSELIGEINNQYSEEIPSVNNDRDGETQDKTKKREQAHSRYCTAMQVSAQALKTFEESQDEQERNANMKKALECQKIAIQLEKILSELDCTEIVIEEKRKIFGDKLLQMGITNIEEMEIFFDECYGQKTVEDRNQGTKVIMGEQQNKEELTR